MCSCWKIKKKNQVFLISSSFSAVAHTPQILSYLVYISLKVFFFPSISLLEFTEELDYKSIIKHLDQEFVSCLKG